MAIKISFDKSNTPESPTLILANRNGNKLGAIKAHNIILADHLNSASEMQFKTYKYENNIKNHLWDKIVDFKLLWCKEWDNWFEIKIDIDESNETVKTVYCTNLGQAELSQTNLYDIEINTEKDIARDDYINPTILYNENDASCSLLHRILEKAPHYSIKYVDSTIKNIQRTFTFDNCSIEQAFEEISKEINCLFIYNSGTASDGTIERSISVYDLESNCIQCNHRGEFTVKCPKCGGTDVNEGYGEDTNIFITSDELSDDIQFTSDTSSIKNCFKLEAGDDLMTSTIKNCNPNGSDYIWYITDDLKSDMSNELVDKINTYNQLYKYYQTEHITELPDDLIKKYNDLVIKYRFYNENLNTISKEIIGYPNLMTAYYDTIDFSIYLKSGLMPNVTMSKTTAAEQAALLNTNNLSPIAVTNLKTLSLTTANSVILSTAKIALTASYKVQVKKSDLIDNIWSGILIVTSYSDETDTAETPLIEFELNDDYETYIQQSIKKELKKIDTDDASITELFQLEYVDFCDEIKKYCLVRLNSFYDACKQCLNLLIEQGISDGETWGDDTPNSDSNLYEKLYLPYYEKLKALESEIAVREYEINSITSHSNKDNTLVQDGIQLHIINKKNHIQNKLDFQKYLGQDLWLEFCSYRREDKYSNSNYISDGLNNAELFKNALEFIKNAEVEIYKSAELQHSISSSLRNLLVIEKFKPFVKSFEKGNWIRIQVDEKIYKLRLLDYEIDYDDLGYISVEFSDVMKTAYGMVDQQSVIQKASSIASSYDTVQRQSEQSAKNNELISGWIEDGLEASNVKIINESDEQNQTWGKDGMLFRKYNAINDSFDDTQLKIINSTIAITDDNWKTTKTALGLFYYRDPLTQELKTSFGVNGQAVVGKLFLGETLGLYNKSNSMSFDQNGLIVKNNINTITINPNSSSLFTIQKQGSPIIYMDEYGNGVFDGKIIAANGQIGNWNIDNHRIYSQFENSEIVYEERQVVDESGNLVFVDNYDSDGNPIYETDSDGNPIYEKDTDGNIIYNTVEVYDTDADGNVIYDQVEVYETDSNGNIVKDSNGNPIVLKDINGNPITDSVPRTIIQLMPIQKIQQIPLMEMVKVVKDNVLDNYTILNSQSTSNISIALGATKDSDGKINIEKAKSKLYNDGSIQCSTITIDNGTDIPLLYFNRKRTNAETSCKIYNWDNDIPGLSFAFNENINDPNSNYTFTTVIDKYGITPYSNNKYSCGTSSRRWENIYTKNIDITGNLIISNRLSMRDEKNRKQDVLRVFHDGYPTYGSNLLIGAGGNIFLGSGESSSTLYNYKYKNSNEEFMFISSDKSIYFYTNCQNGIQSSKSIVLTAGLYFSPTVSNTGSLGGGYNRWGNIFLKNSPNVASDRRLKKDLEEIYKAKELILNLIPYQYKFNQTSSDRIHYGFISQQLKEVIDSLGINNCGAWLCDLSEEGKQKGYTLENAPEEYKMYGLRYEELIAPIVATIQDINNRLEIIESNLKRPA